MFQVKPETIIPFRDVKTHSPHTILYPLEHGPMMIYTFNIYVETCSLDDSRKIYVFYMLKLQFSMANCSS